jgi:hypothetical protein
MSIEAAGTDRGGSLQLHVRRHLPFFVFAGLENSSLMDNIAG